MQRLATKAAADNLTLGVDEDVVGDGVNLICRSCGAFPTLQVGELQPRHVELPDGLYPSFLFLIEGDADHLESLGVVLVVGLEHVGHFLAARATP